MLILSRFRAFSAAPRLDIHHAHRGESSRLNRSSRAFISADRETVACPTRVSATSTLWFNVLPMHVFRIPMRPVETLINFFSCYVVISRERLALVNCTARAMDFIVSKKCSFANSAGKWIFSTLSGRSILIGFLITNVWKCRIYWNEYSLK